MRNKNQSLQSESSSLLESSTHYGDSVPHFGSYPAPYVPPFQMGGHVYPQVYQIPWSYFGGFPYRVTDYETGNEGRMEQRQIPIPIPLPVPVPYPRPYYPRPYYPYYGPFYGPFYHPFWI